MHNYSIKKALLTAIVALQLIVLMGCGIEPDDDSEGGVIGTGIKGTATTLRAYASNTLQIKSRTGQTSSAVIDGVGRFDVASAEGAPPYLLRLDLGNDEYRYGISFGGETANLHSYTDVIMRNWFESNNGDIDFEFEQETFSTALPSRLDFRRNANRFFSFVSLVLDSYQLTGEQLLTGDYDTQNNQDGIDSYLRSNPMFIQDENIALVITDPVTQKQSTTRSSFSVFELVTDDDNEVPTDPSGLRALPSASNEIVLVWEPASDNTSVVGYDVYREDELVATTPYPVYVDTGLESGLRYFYEVVAIDSSGNRSARSVPATSSTLAEPDSIAPPAPIQLSATAKIGRLDLIWGQDNIADVVEFDVYRGLRGSSIEFLTTVTSSVHTDVTASSGVEYCYQVVALDAAGNESERSIEDCETTIGNAVVRTTDQPVPQVAPLAGLSIPNINDLDCDIEFTEYEIDSSVTVVNGCYLVDESIEVLNGGNFQLSAGAVLIFGAGTGISVEEGGSITAEGTKASPVVFSAQDPTPGYWNGILLRDSNSSRNKLINSVIEYAGGGREAAALSVRASSGEISRFEVSGSVIRNCAGSAISAVDDGAILSKVDGSVFTECDSPMMVHIEGLSNVTSRNDFTGNLNDWIDVGDAAVLSDMQLADLGVPYVVTDMRIRSGNFKANAGVELLFREGASLLVDGALTVMGEDGVGVSFKGTNNEPGHWRGIRVRGRAELRHLRVENGGLLRSSVPPGSVVLENGELIANHLFIGNGSSFGLNVGSRSSVLSQITKLEISDNEKTIRIPFENLSQLGREVSFENNANPFIELTERDISASDVDVYDLGVPYFRENNLFVSGSSINIHSGVAIFMGDSVQITFDTRSKLVVSGTSAAPVLLSHERRIPGSWQGIKFSSNALNVLERTTIEFAGGGPDPTASALQINCDIGVSLILNNTTIQDNAGWGIGKIGNNSCDLQLGDNVVFARNAKGAINVP